MFITSRIFAAKVAMRRVLLAAGVSGVLAVLSVGALGARDARAGDLDATSYRVTVKPAAERPTILDLVSEAQRSIRATLHDLAALDGDDAAAPGRGSVLDALARKARAGVEVELLVDRDQSHEEIVRALVASGVHVLERGQLAARAGEESFVIDDEHLLVLSLHRLPSIARAREYGVQTNEPTTVADVVRVFTAAFSSEPPAHRQERVPGTMEVRGPGSATPENRG